MYMNIKDILTKYKNVVVGTGLFFFLVVSFVIAYNFPIVGDDFYGTHDFITSVRSFFELAYWHWNNTNGRSLGNTTVILVIHSKFLRAFVRAVIIWIIIILTYKNSKIKSRTGYLVSFLYVLAIPMEIFSETYSWAYGFFNYVPPVMLVLLYLYMVQYEFEHKLEKYQIPKVIIVFLIGMCNQLFMENVSIYVLVMSVTMNIWYARLYKKPSLTMAGHTVGVVIGTILMFSSPVYRTVINATDTYRETPKGMAGIFMMIRENWCEVSRYAIRGNILLLLTVTCLCFWLLYRENTEQDKKYKVLRLVNGCTLTMTTAYFLSATLFLEWDQKIELYTAFFLLDFLMFVLFIVSVLICISLFVYHKEQKFRILFWLISAFVLAGPLLIVSPIGPRCFYASYIFTVIAVFSIMEYIIESEQWDIKKISVYLCVLTVCVAGYYVYVFENIGQVEQERDMYIVERMQEGDSLITVPEFPYSEYLHDPHGWKIGLKYYYDKQEDIQFCFVPYDEWTNIKKE